MMDIILASKSPRRKELLEKINLKFKIIESKYIEKQALTSQDKYCIEMAHNKALDVAKNYNNSLIIGADTIVSFKNKILGKPKNLKEAKRGRRDKLFNRENTTMHLLIKVSISLTCI